MNRLVYTYTNLQELGSCSFWNDIKSIPQVVVTSDLRKSLNDKRQEGNVGGLFNDYHNFHACEFRLLSETVKPDWTKDETKFRELVVLSQFIRNEIDKNASDTEMKSWLIGCRRNLGMLLSSIILLEEAAVRPEDIIADGDRNIKFLISAWKYLIENDDEIVSYRNRMLELEERNKWDDIFNELFKKREITKLVFHGFYYFTPYQERIMRLLEKVGVQLIFLFAYDDRYQHANEIWRKTYSEDNGYPDKASWISQKSTIDEPYGEIFEGRKAQIFNKLKLIEYGSVIDFVNEIKHEKDKGYYIYSSNPKSANKILREFYPEAYGERKFLSYPIGQFISILNKMWDEDLQDIILTSENVIECFSSGWLAIDGVSGKQYMQDLAYIINFFQDCNKVSEWEERIVLLRDIHRNVISKFRSNLSQDDNKTSRWQEIMGNPFMNFSVFTVPAEKLEGILALIERLLVMAKDLFGIESTVHIREHIKKLDKILNEHEMSNELYKEERELVEEIFTKLQDPSGFTAKCFPSDISSALNLLMSGKLDEGEILSYKAGMVSPIFQIDAACIKQKGRIHICLCDIKNMPGGAKDYVWPLTSHLIKDCYRRTKNPYLASLIFIMENNHICNRYFMYAGLKNKDVQVSWIKKEGEKVLAPSPYVQLIMEATGVDITPAKLNKIYYNQVQEATIGRGKILPYDKERMPLKVSKEARMDYAICPMKYLLGYVVEKSPTFQKEFQQSYAITGFIAAINSLMKSQGMPADVIYQNVIKLFPGLRGVEKRQILDYSQEIKYKDIGSIGGTEIGGFSYTVERLKVRFPENYIREKAIEKHAKLMTPDGQTGMNLYVSPDNVKVSSGKKGPTNPCQFCQHQDYCRNTKFTVDQEAQYDE
jgi:hypothetical protein